VRWELACTLQTSRWSWFNGSKTSWLGSPGTWRNWQLAVPPRPTPGSLDPICCTDP
jgi:hypothetical protein